MPPSGAAVPSAAGLAALAALAVAGVASAQSSVTLFGIVDASVSHYTTKSSYVTPPLYTINSAGQLVLNPITLAPATPYGAKRSQTVLANSGYNSSRLGFRGTEDLGGGLAASFWLEAGIGNDAGGGLGSFNRRSTVSLSGGFGEIRLGRDYTPTFWNDTVFDPFGTNSVGSNLISTVSNNLASLATPTVFGLNPATGGLRQVPDATFVGDNYVRTSNSIGYFLPPNLGGFYGQVQYAFPEQIKNSSGVAAAANTCFPGTAAGDSVSCNASSKNRYIGGRFGYANGPLDVALSYGQSTVNDVDGTALAAVLVPGLGGASLSQAYTADRKLKTLNLGASYDFGPVKLFGELSQVKDKYELTRSTSASAVIAGTSFGAGSGQFASQTNKYNGALIGVTIPVGAGLIRAAYSRVKFDNGAPGSSGSYSYPPVAYGFGSLNPFAQNRDATANKFAIGYVHNLSKRTALYATVARIRIKGGENDGAMAASTSGSVTGLPSQTTPTYLSTGNFAPRSATGYDFGIRHSF
ncbi:MAG TPA: porin [Burkholderiaceae bacterium]|nr:porin [Burkholderiaceae bacterium]